MSTTRIRGNTQVMDNTIDLGRLELSFINSSTGNWDITAGAQDALITGIKLQPTNDSDVASKWYVDQENLLGVEWKTSVQFSTSTGGVGTYNAAGGTAASGAFTGVDFTGASVFDLGGHTVLVGDRVLVRNQADAKQNGIYEVTSTGATGGLIRSVDQDGVPSSEVSIGNATYVENGYTYEGTHWVVTKPIGYDGSGVLTLNTDEIPWSQFSGVGTYISGDGIDISGMTISVDVTDIIDTAAGLTENGNNIQVALVTNGGLDFNGTNGIEVDVTDFINTSSGLTESGGDIKVNIGAGLAFDAGGAIDVQVDGTTVEINGSNQVGVISGVFAPASHNHVPGDITGFDEAAEDAVGGILLDTNSINLTYDDTNIYADVIVSSTGGLEITGSGVGIKADGILDSMINWGTSTGQVSAVDMPIEDVGDYYAVHNVEAALQELGVGLAGTYTFKTIDTPFGTDPVADTTADTLTLQSSSGVIVITGDATLDSVDFDIALDGIKDYHIDWGTGADQVSAVDVPIADAGNYFTSTGVEGALQELGALMPGMGVTEVWGETPAVTNNTYTVTLANPPTSNGIVRIYLNGIRNIYTQDFTISGTTVTFVEKLKTNDVVAIDYRW